MSVFLDILTSYPTVVFTVLLLVAVLYWLLWPIQMIIPYALISTALRHLAFAIWPGLKPAAEAAA